MLTAQRVRFPGAVTGIRAKKCRARRHLPIIRAEQQSTETETATKKRSVGEMEQEFLEAMRSFYYDGKPSISNEEFDALKEELLWEGSQVVILSSAEQRFLEASMAYNAGNPIMSDEEYKALKDELKKSGSGVTKQGPRCSIRSKKMYSDAGVDYLKMGLVNVPALLATLSSVFALDYVSNFAVTYAIELPSPWGFLFTWVILVPTIYTMTTGITQFVLRDWVILKSQCPNCGTDQNAYFGDIFIVQGTRDSLTVDCLDCGSSLKWDNNERVVTVERIGPKPAPAKKAGKKKAPAE
ncbi:unnamed protein product [Pedinophyceae sp. YPF-701]|nr:unnamed protein product [Pedinophyceae sp. YPF-701]